jgi:hypothetical protein
MKEIKLTQGFITLVDDEDFEYLNQFKWCAAKINKNYYASKGRSINLIKMHRLIMKTPKGFVVDHIDHNTLNNQKSNLRNCLSRQNTANRTPSGTSKYLGVSVFKTGKFKGKISGYITANKKRYSLGYFKTEEAAARKYDEMAKMCHGEFANLNFK